MCKHNRTNNLIQFPTEDAKDQLTPILLEGARKILEIAIREEAQSWIDSRSHLIDVQGHKLIVKNGFQQERSIQTGLGGINVKQPRAHDRRKSNEREAFTSKILPPYLRRAKSIEELIPWLYLKGISTGGFGEALQSLLGVNAPGLSATTIARMVQVWQEEYADWSKRSLEDKHYVYVWADGIYFNIRLAEESNKKQCSLVMMGATADGKKELIAVLDGFRESEQSWTEMLNDLQRRGLKEPPSIATDDGALGFWAALPKVWSSTRGQRCWVHKTANVLNKLPKSMQEKAKSGLHEIWQADTREHAIEAFDAFIEDFEARYPKAVECLEKDREQLLVFYDFPVEHWPHLRTTNPIESTFATVRLRHRRTKGSGSRAAGLAMVFKLARSAENRWRRLNSYQLISDVIRGVQCLDGIKKVAA